MTTELDIVGHLITVAPVVAVLVWVVIHFRIQLKTKEERIDTLNDELRQSEKEAIVVMKDLNQTLKELIAGISKR